MLIFSFVWNSLNRTKTNLLFKIPGLQFKARGRRQKNRWREVMEKHHLAWKVNWVKNVLLLLCCPPIFLLPLRDVTDPWTHTDIQTAGFLSLPHGSFFFLSFLFLFLPSKNLPCRQTHTHTSPTSWNKGLIGWCWAVVTLPSLNQSFSQLLRLPPPFLFLVLSPVFLFSLTCLSSGTSFSSSMWTLPSLTLLCFLTFKKK